MFRLKYEKPSSGKLTVRSESYHVDYIKPM